MSLNIVDFLNKNNIPVYWKSLSANTSINISILKKYSDKLRWDFWGLSTNPIVKLEWLKLFPNKNWDWISLSKNPNLDINWLKAFPNKKWSWDVNLSQHKNLKLEWINAFPGKNWDFHIICKNPNLDINFILEYPDKFWWWNLIVSNQNFEISWINKISKVLPNVNIHWTSYIRRDCKFLIKDLTENIENDLIFHKTNFTPDLLRKYPNKNWITSDIGLLSLESFSFDWIDKYPDVNWDWVELSRSPRLTTRYYLKLLNYFKKCKNLLFDNPNLNLKWINAYPDNEWHWRKRISRSKNLKFNWIKKYRNKDWDFELVCNSPHFDINWLFEIEKLYNKKNKPSWDFKKLSDHKNFDIEWLIKYPNERWNYNEIFLHKNFNLEWLNCLKKKKSIKIDYHNLSYNKNLNLHWILKYPNEKWDFEGITRNNNFNIKWIKEINKRIDQQGKYSSNISWDYLYINQISFIEELIKNRIRTLWLLNKMFPNVISRILFNYLV